MKSLKLTHSLFLLLATSVIFAQNNTAVKRPNYQEMTFSELSNELTKNGYVAQNGTIFKEGGTFKLGKGSMPNKSFAFAYEKGIISNSTAYDKKYLGSQYSQRECKINNLMPMGFKKNNHQIYIVFRVGGGTLFNYYCEIDNAIEAGEILTNSNSKPIVSEIIPNNNEIVDKKSSNSSGVADELLKYKQLVDAGLMTKEEFQVQKNRLLNQGNNSNTPVKDEPKKEEQKKEEIKKANDSNNIDLIKTNNLRFDGNNGFLYNEGNIPKSEMYKFLNNGVDLSLKDKMLIYPNDSDALKYFKKAKRGPAAYLLIPTGFILGGLVAVVSPNSNIGGAIFSSFSVAGIILGTYGLFAKPTNFKKTAFHYNKKAGLGVSYNPQNLKFGFTNSGKLGLVYNF